MTSEPSTQLLVDFLRTDDLVAPETIANWFVENGLARQGTSASVAAAAAFRHSRAALRSLLNENIGGPVDSRTRETLAQATAAAPLRLRFGPGGPVLESEDDGIAGGLAILAGLVYRADADGTLPRFKACKACGWGFYDASKNRSRVWCDMALCGSQHKARAYRTRKRQAAE